MNESNEEKQIKANPGDTLLTNSGGWPSRTIRKMAEGNGYDHDVSIVVVLLLVMIVGAYISWAFYYGSSAPSPDPIYTGTLHLGEQHVIVVGALSEAQLKEEMDMVRERYEMFGEIR